MPPSPEHAGQPYTHEDLLREAHEAFEKLSGVFKSALTEAKTSETAVFLNNFHLNLPLGSDRIRMHRESMRSGPRKAALFEAIDVYCVERHFDFGEVAPQDVYAKREKEIHELYLFLRNQGFTHAELTS